MSESKKGRKDLTQREEKRKEVKEYYLKNSSIKDIAKATGVSQPTVRKYIQYWQAYYTKLAINNPHIAEKQVARVEGLLDEVNLVKREYWDLYKEIQDKVQDDKDKKKKNTPAYFNTRMDVLKSIMGRIEHEAKLMNLFNPANLIQNNYIALETFKALLGIVKTIIMEFVPADKRNYAIQRMRAIDVKAMDGKKIVDAEIIEEK